MRYITVLAVVAAVAALNTAEGQEPQIKWGPAPAVFAPGAKFAVVQGDPGQPGIYTVRLELPNGYVIAPHFHPTDEHVTVIHGTFLVGMGDKVDRSKTMSLPVGGFITAGAKMHHFGIAKGRTIVQVHGMGPFALTYVNPADDPQAKKTAKK